MIARLLVVVALGVCHGTALGQSAQEDFSLADALAELSQGQPGQPGQPGHTPSARFTTSASQYNDEWVASLYGSFEVTERVSVTMELDTDNYIAAGVGYSFLFSRAIVEPYVNYGRSDLVDVYDLGIFGAYMLTPKTTAYGITGHQWRETNIAPILAPNLFDQTEWRTTAGVNYRLVEWMDVDLSLSYDRLLSGNRGINEVQNDGVTSGSMALYFKTKPVQPFVRFTVGEHRVRPGDPVFSDNSLEFGIRMAFD